MQLRMNTATREQAKNAWAFAVDTKHSGKRARMGQAWRHVRDLRKAAVCLDLFGGSEPSISEGGVALATPKEERTGAARQNESGVLGALRESCINHSVITACSKEAKALGIQAGMHYEDARALLPELKVFVYGRS